MGKILVTGSSGFLGRAICQHFAERGEDVLGVDQALPTTGFGWRQVQCNLSTADLPEFLRSESPGTIIHCAGNANVGLSVQDPLMDLQGSFVLLTRMFHSCELAGIRPKIIFFSSAAVYGNPEVLPIAEGAARRPVSPYGLHKMACEDLCDYASRVMGFDCRVIRIFSAYGVGLRKQILWDLCGKIVASGEIKLFGTGNETRDFINVRDVVLATSLVLHGGSAGGVYNVACGQETPISDLVRSLLSAANESFNRIRFVGQAKDGDPLYWRADIGQIQALGFAPTVDLDEGVKEYWRWYQSLEV
jgi:UDP-glucose 4-epimerase